MSTSTRPGYATLIAIAGLSLGLPIALLGFDVGDQIHLVWARHFASQLWAGDIYPRWLSGMNSGLGSPTFFYYGPLPYFITALFYPLCAFFDSPWLPVGLSAAVALAASGVTFFSWIRKDTGELPAAVAALTYVVLPYHFLVDHLQRFSFGEIWSFVWIPCVLAATRTVTTRSRVPLALAACYALLVMTHLPTALLFTPVALAYGTLLCVRGHAGYRRLLSCYAGFAAGLALAAVYLVPALRDQYKVSMQVMFSGHGSYLNHFLFGDIVAPSSFTQSFLEYARAWKQAIQEAMLITAGVALLAFLSWRTSGDLKHGAGNGFWLAIAAGAMFMMLPLSQPVWEALPALTKVQFPWRLGTVLTLATAALVAFAVKPLRSPAQAMVSVGLALLAGFVLLQDVRGVWWNIHGDKTMREDVVVMDYPEYRPRDVSTQMFTIAAIREMSSTLPLAKIDAGASVNVERWRPREVVLRTEAGRPATVVVKQFHYDGWRARLEPSGPELPLQPAVGTGLISIRVPAGSQRITVELPTQRSEQVGALISAATLGLLLTLLVARRPAHGTGTARPAG